MAANIQMTINSPHGGKTRMDLNPEQVSQLVDILDGHRDFKGDAFGPWFVANLLPHADERPTP